jgi:hypothetical protein
MDGFVCRHRDRLPTLSRGTTQRHGGGPDQRCGEPVSAAGRDSRPRVGLMRPADGRAGRSVGASDVTCCAPRTTSQTPRRRRTRGSRCPAGPRLRRRTGRATCCPGSTRSASRSGRAPRWCRAHPTDDGATRPASAASSRRARCSTKAQTRAGIRLLQPCASSPRRYGPGLEGPVRTFFEGLPPEGPAEADRPGRVGRGDDGAAVDRFRRE